jgi:hypothetical protein
MCIASSAIPACFLLAITTLCTVLKSASSKIILCSMSAPFNLEREKRIELLLPDWQTGTLPLSYSRLRLAREARIKLATFRSKGGRSNRLSYSPTLILAGYLGYDPSISESESDVIPISPIANASNWLLPAESNCDLFA